MNRKVLAAALMLSALLVIPGPAQSRSLADLHRCGHTGPQLAVASAPGDRTAVAFTPADCKLAIKVLTQYERLAEKLGVKISAKRLKELNRKRDDRTITSNDLPAKLRRNFPGYFQGMSLRDIARQCYFVYRIGLPWTGWA